MMKLLKYWNSDEKEFKLIVDVLKKHIPKWVRVFIFWSRAVGKHKRNSDRDIGLEWKKVNLDLILKLKNEFEELPVLVDIVDFNNVDSQFKEYVFKEWIIDLTPFLEN